MKRIVVLLTACLLLLGLSVSVAAQSSVQAQATDYPDLTYSENSKKACLYMGDLLAQIPGFKISDQEKSYIRYQFSGQNALYYVKPSVIDLDYKYDGETGQLTIVMMDDYQVLQKLGKDVVWTPTTANLGDLTASFSPAPDVGENYYRAVLKDVKWSESVNLTIEYASDFTITADTLNDFVNFAYEKAVQLDQEYVTFEAQLLAYQTAKQDYDKYREDLEKYNSEYDKYTIYLNSAALYRDYLAYQAYLKQVDEYEIAHQAFLANSREWATYEQNLAKYQAYIEYKNSRYPALYQAYQNDMGTAQHQLYLLSLLEVKDPNTGVSFIDMMVDDRIGEMIENKRTQVELAVGSGTTNEVITSTRELQRFCKTYRTLTTDQEKYTFYIKEYAGFVKHLRKLYDNIQKLYKNETIYRVLKNEYPDSIVNLVRMLGSLYVQRCVFDDTVTLNMSTVVDSRGNQQASVLVHESVRPKSDTNKAAPLTSWPVAPQDPETYEVKVMPVKPAVKLQDAVHPTMPEFSYVSNAQEIPARMEDPGYMAEPTKPDEVAHPGPAPALDWNETTQTLYEAYQAGLIEQRPLFVQDQVLSLKVDTNLSISLDESERRYYVHFYNTDDKETYLGHSLGVKSGESASIPEEFLTASKPPETEIAYEFAGWVDRDGDPLDLSCLTQDINAYASYREVPRKYNVTWEAGDQTIVEQWPYGEIPTYTGSTYKSPSVQYTYSFVGWDRKLVPVTGDVTYTAQYEHTDRRYQVKFDMGDGTIETGTYVYGRDLTDVVAALKKPYRAPDAQYTYEFIGWKDAEGNLYKDHTEFPTVSGDETFTAEFKSILNSYTVTWIVEGQSMQIRCEYGEIPIYGATSDTVPIKETDERYYYVFDGWNTEIVPVTGDVTYTALFTPQTRYYRVDFVIEGEAFTFELEYEQLPEFGDIPQKESDVQYHYTFVGWDKEPVPVREDAIYIAEFGKVLRKYPVKFVVGGNEITSEFDYGTEPVYPNKTPTKPDDSVYYYVFAGWDKPIVKVDGSAVTYTACFDAVALAPVSDGENGKLTIDGASGRFELKLSGTQVDISHILEKAGKENARLLQVYFGDAILEFSHEQIKAFYLMGESLAKVTLAHTEHEGYTAYRIELTDKSGAPIAYLVSELTVKLPYSGIYTADVFHVEDDGSMTKLQSEHKDGYLVFSTMDFSTFVLKDKFLIEKMPTENGVFDVIGEAYAGEMIVITPNPDEGYHVDEILLDYNGQQFKVEPVDGKYAFIMPHGNVQLTTVYKVVEGGTVAEVIVGVVTALLIVAIGFVIALILHRRKAVKV